MFRFASPHPGRFAARPLGLPLIVITLLASTLLWVPSASSAPEHIEDYASWQPVKRCAPKAKRGTVTLSRWIVKSYGGGEGYISRSCGSTSEHTEGRAFDWPLNADRKADRVRAKKFLKRILRTDNRGNDHAWARRMGVMYVIWKDRIYSAWNEFEPEPYLSSSCQTRKRCSKTLRHRDHVHISLTRRGGKGKTSWYANRH